MKIFAVMVPNCLTMYTSAEQQDYQLEQLIERNFHCQYAMLESDQYISIVA